MNLTTTVKTVRALVESGLLTPRLDRIVHKAKSVKAYGPTPAAGFVAAARSFPDRTYLIDDEGSLTFGEVDRRTNQIANELLAAGVGEGDGVGLLCRNGRAFVEGLLACSKIGATVLFLNTDFAGPQLIDVLEREHAKALISDGEFDRLLPADALPGRRWVGFADQPTSTPRLTDLLDVRTSADRPPAPARVGRLVILTSGTTGAPKGAARDGAPLTAIIGILDRLPFRAGQVHHIVAPMFHGWGLLNYTLGLALPTTIVLRRRFDPEETLRVIAEHGVQSAPMVPTMLKRIMQLPAETLAKYDTSSLKAIPLSGSAIPGNLAVEAMDAFGDVVYNFYGSTETGWATIGTPTDLRAEPGTAGTAPLGTGLMIVDDENRPVPHGTTGRIFVSSQLRMATYTDADLRKAMVDGHMSSGDVGHLDQAGRLFVDGRDDDMIVSGGENVFPREVEDLLSQHDEVVEAAVIGMPDETFGQCLKGYVVLTEGSTLTGEDLRVHVRANLARYKVPKEIVLLDVLPRNPTGKVLKRELDAVVAASATKGAKS